MDDIEISKEPIEVYFRPKCPVKIGDHFYRNNYEVKKGRMGPDRIEVVNILPSKEPGYFYIEGKYLQHTVGTHRTFSSVIFKDPDWIIERKGIDF